jgi:hypothetical protein
MLKTFSDQISECTEPRDLTCLRASTISWRNSDPLPQSLEEISGRPDEDPWKAAIEDEFNSMEKHNVWT